MFDLVEYDFRFPHFQPAPDPLRRNMDLFLSRGKTCGNFQYEEQKKAGVTFRDAALLHLDDNPFVKRIGYKIIEMCTTSTPPIFVDGAIGIDPSVHHKFANKEFIAPAALRKLDVYFGEEDWLDKFIFSGGDTSQFPGIHVTRDFYSTQAKPYELVTGSTFTTLHKSAPRFNDDPHARVFYRRFADFYLGNS